MAKNVYGIDDEPGFFYIRGLWAKLHNRWPTLPEVRKMIRFLRNDVPQAEIDRFCEVYADRFKHDLADAKDPNLDLLDPDKLDERMATMKRQRAEFDAAAEFVLQFGRVTRTAVVDDDYPQVRHEYESALADFLDAMVHNGRFEKGNRYGLVKV